MLFQNQFHVQFRHACAVSMCAVEALTSASLCRDMQVLNCLYTAPTVTITHLESRAATTPFFKKWAKEIKQFTRYARGFLSGPQRAIRSNLAVGEAVRPLGSTTRSCAFLRRRACWRFRTPSFRKPCAPSGRTWQRSSPRSSRRCRRPSNVGADPMGPAPGGKR